MCWSVYSWGTISTLKTINSIYTPTERYSEKCRWRISLLHFFFFLFLIDFLFIELDPQLKANALLSQIPQLTDIELCVCSLEKKTGVGATKWNHKIPRSSSTIYPPPQIHCRHSTEGLVGDGNKVVPPLYSQRSEMRFLLFLFFFIELL